MKSRALILLVPAALALSACAVVPGNPSYGYGYGYDAGPTWVEPAPYYYQTVPPSPYVGGLWIAGSWNDVHGRREWRPGHWVPPRAGEVRGQPPQHGDVRGQPWQRGDGRYAGDQGHRPPRTDRGDDRRSGNWGFADRGDRDSGRQRPEFPGAAFDAHSRTDPRITPP